MKKGVSTWAGPGSVKPCLLEGPLGQIEEIEGPGLCLRAVSTYLLASNKGREIPTLISATSQHLLA